MRGTDKLAVTKKLMQNPFTSLVALALVVAVAAPSLAQNKTWRVKKTYIVPLKNDVKDCWALGNHGNLHIVYRDGRDVKITKNGAACKDAQISPDGHTVGYTIGTHKPCTDWSIGGTMFVNSKLVLVRDGKQLRVLQVPGTFIEGWRFWNNGKYVAVGSRWHHGLGYVRLFDVKSGKLLERMTTPEAETKKLKWAKDLTA